MSPSGCCETPLAFADARLAPLQPGVYTVWSGATLVYAGMASRLRTRLMAHASGRRSGDQFCVYVCDRFVVPTLTPEDLRAVADGTLRLDGRTRQFIHAHLHVCWRETASIAEARALERSLRHGPPAPLLNPA